MLELADLSTEDVKWFALSNLGVAIKDHRSRLLNTVRNDSFAAVCQALNLQTESRQSVLRNGTVLGGYAWPQFGLKGARLALVGCPAKERLAVLEEIELDNRLPHLKLEGVWMKRSPVLKRSYFLCGGLSEANVEQWIKYAKLAGSRYLMITGWMKTFGHYLINERNYPHGFEGLKATVAKIHAAGLKAGMHCMTGSISKHDPWVTPVPDRRLAADAHFALAQAITAKANSVPVTTSPQGLPLEEGYTQRGGITLRIDDELIKYRALSERKPYAFLECERGAYGTKPAPHAAGAAVVHLAERYSWFMVDTNTDLLDELADIMAGIYNECGFDMVYFDGGEALGGQGPHWHHVSKVKLSIVSKVRRDILVQGSGNTHLTWHIYARGNCDDPSARASKRYLDFHKLPRITYYGNSELETELGWYALRAHDPVNFATTPDEVEYVCAKTIGYDVPLSWNTNLRNLERNRRSMEMLTLCGRYEKLRAEHYFRPKVCERLRVKGDEFRLIQRGGEWEFLPVDYGPAVTASVGASGTNQWTISNRFAAQPLQVRLRALPALAPYEAPEAAVLAGPEDAGKFASVGQSAAVKQELTASREQVKAGGGSLRFTATNEGPSERVWCGQELKFRPPLNLTGQYGLGVWVYGDGKGELLNVQLMSRNDTRLEHYLDVDFTGWRYFELVEPETDRVYDYRWPYGDKRALSDGAPNYITALSLYYNNLPPGQTVTCYLAPIKSLVLATVKLRQPSLMVNGRKVTYPCTLRSGSYLEVLSPNTGKVYGPDNELLKEIKLDASDTPTVRAGDNRLAFGCEPLEGYTARALIEVIREGEPFGN